MAGYPPPNYGAYEQPSAPHGGYPPNPQAGFMPPPGYPSQPGYPAPQGYPAQAGYPQGYPAQAGYPPGYPAQQGYPSQPVIAQPGAYYPGQPPQQTVYVQEKRDDDCAKDCCICALCTALCCFCCSD